MQFMTSDYLWYVIHCNLSVGVAICYINVQAFSFTSSFKTGLSVIIVFKFIKIIKYTGV